MATLDELVASGHIKPILGVLASNELAERRLFCLPSVINWMHLNLNDLQTDGFVEGAVTPKQQVNEQINGFVRGDDYENWMVPHMLRPKELGVWELRTPDLRFFGWFQSKANFVITAVDTAKRCKDLNLYAGYCGECVWHRDQLNLDEPKYTNQGLEYVFGK